MAGKMDLRLKVPTDDLVKLAERRRKAIVSAHAKAVADYKAAVPRAVAEMKRKLRAEAASLKATPENTRYGELRSRAVVKLPPKPADKPDLWKIDRMLAMLRATSEDVISVRADSELAALLGPS